MAENTTCEIKNMPQTPTGRRGRILFAQPGGIIYLFGFVFCRRDTFLFARPSKNIKWEQTKHRNGSQFTEMRAIRPEVLSKHSGGDG